MTIQRWLTFDREWHKSAHGDWVQWDDVKALVAELERLRAERVVAVTARCKDCGSYCDDIQFEYAKPQS